MQALLLSPATRFSPDSSSSSPASPATPPPPSLDFLLMPDSPLARFDTPNAAFHRKHTPPRDLPSIERAEPPAPATPSWLSPELDEEWMSHPDGPAQVSTPPTSTDDSLAESHASALHTSESASASLSTLVPPDHTLRPASPPSASSSPSPSSALSTPHRTLTEAAYASLPKTQPRVPSSLRHGFTASTSTAATSAVDADTDVEADGTRDMSVIEASTVDDSLALPSVRRGQDEAGTADVEESRDDSVGSAGTCVVNSIVERSADRTSLAGGEGQLAAAVRALRGPNAGLFSAAVADDQAASEGAQEAGAAVTAQQSKVGLLGLFEPPSPPTQPTPLPKSTQPAPSLPSFTFSPPEPVPRTSWKSLPLLSPSPSPPRTDNDATPVARTRASKRVAATAAEGVETPTAQVATAATPLQREAGAGGMAAPTGPGKRERFLKRSAPSRPQATTFSAVGADTHASGLEADESSDDAPFVPPPQTGTTTSESEGLSDDDDDEEEEADDAIARDQQGNLVDTLGLAGPGQPGLGWSSDEDDGDENHSTFSREDVSLPISNGLSALPSPPVAPYSTHLGLPLPPSPRALPASPARIPFPSPALSTRTAPPPSPLRLFQPTYDTLTQAHLAQLVDEIDELGENRESYLLHGAPAPPQLGAAAQEPHYHRESDLEYDQGQEHSDEGFLGEEGEKRSAKRIRLSPRSERRRQSELSIVTEEPLEGDENSSVLASTPGLRYHGSRRASSLARSGSTSPVSTRRRSTPALRRARAYTPSRVTASARSVLRSSGLSLPSLPGLPVAPDSARSSLLTASPRSPELSRRRESGSPSRGSRVDEANALMERIRARVEEREARRSEGRKSPISSTKDMEDDPVRPASRGPRPPFSRAQSTTPPSSPPPLRSSYAHPHRQSHFAAAASASLRSVLSSPAAPLPSTSSASSSRPTIDAAAAPGSPSLALGLPPSLREAKDRGGSLGRRHFARTSVVAAVASAGQRRVAPTSGADGKGARGEDSLLRQTQAKRLFGTEADDTAAAAETGEAHNGEHDRPQAAPVSNEGPIASTSAPPFQPRQHGHARHPSLTTLHPASRDTQILLASAGASARQKGLIFDPTKGRWIRTPSRVAAQTMVEETDQEALEGDNEEEDEDEDPFRDFSELRSAEESKLAVGLASAARPAAVNLDALPHAGDGSGSLPRGVQGNGLADMHVTRRSRSRTSAALDLSGLGITKGTPPLPVGSSAVKPVASMPQPSPANACYFDEPPAEERPQGEDAAGPPLVLESEDSATWGRGEVDDKNRELENRLDASKEAGMPPAGEASDDDSLFESSMLGLYRAAHGALDPDSETTEEVAARSVDQTAPNAAPATPASVSRPASGPTRLTPVPVVPRSALKPTRSHSVPDGHVGPTSGSWTPLRATSEPPRVPRSVSFSDGKTSGKIEGLVPVPIAPALAAFGSRLKFEVGNRREEDGLSGGEGPGSLEFDEAFRARNETGEDDGDGDGDGDRTVTQEKHDGVDSTSLRSKGINAALTDLARGPDDAPFAHFSRTSPNSSLALSSASSASPVMARARSGSRSFVRTQSQTGNATFLTECSFGVSHDRLLQYITDVEPFEPDWEHLRSIDLSCKKAESVVRMKEFLPRLDEVNLNGNELSYLTGIPASLRTLLVVSNHITSLTSFKHLPNLERLDLSHNQLDSVHQLASLRHLRELKLDGNQVTSLDGLDGLDSLVKLSLKNNALVEIDLSRTNWIRLETLHLTRNQLVDVKGAERLVSLTTLNLDQNKLSSFEPTGELTRLRVLRLSGNPLASLDVSFAPKLRTLYVDSAQLGGLIGTERLRKLENLSVRDQSGGALTLPMANIRDVKRLYLSGNPLPSSFPSEKFFNLAYLELAMCQLTSLPADFAAVVPNVRVLNLDYNFVEDLSPLAGLTRLTKLSVVGGRVAKARPLAGVLSTLTELESIDLRMNPFTLAFYPPLVPPSDSLLPSHTEHRILHPDDLSASLSASTLADPATRSSAWQVLDTKFRRALPDAWYHRRAAYRAVLMQAVPTLVRLDGLDCAKERPKLARRMDKLARKVTA